MCFSREHLRAISIDFFVSFVTVHGINTGRKKKTLGAHTSTQHTRVRKARIHKGSEEMRRENCCPAIHGTAPIVRCPKITDGGRRNTWNAQVFVFIHRITDTLEERPRV